MSKDTIAHLEALVLEDSKNKARDGQEQNALQAARLAGSRSR